MLVQAANLVIGLDGKGTGGIKKVPQMMDEVEATQPFGSFFARNWRFWGDTKALFDWLPIAEVLPKAFFRCHCPRSNR